MYHHWLRSVSIIDPGPTSILLKKIMMIQVMNPRDNFESIKVELSPYDQATN